MQQPHDRLNSETQARQRWMSVLARSPLAELENAWRELVQSHPHCKSRYKFLRAPECGLAMVRARAGGSGDRFNLGEMSLTRCALKLESGEVGVSYVQGRSKRKAEIAAHADALLQSRATHDAVMREVVQPLRDQLERRASETRNKAAQTRVEFFTLVRGDSGAGA